MLAALRFGSRTNIVSLQYARRFATQSPPPPPPPSSSPPPPPPNFNSNSNEPALPPPSPTTLSLDFSPQEREQERERERTGARSSKDSLSTNERQRRVLLRTSLALSLLGFGAGCVYLGRDWTPEELRDNRMTIEDAPSTRIGRTKARVSELFNLFSKPQWTELLPPPLPPPHSKPYTLLLSVDDLLVTSTWDRQKGWRTAKRPGVDYFLAYLSQFYEIVVFTTQHHYTANPVLDQLDPYGFFIQYRLFREGTRAINGVAVKDLSYLNRDLSKVILLDTHPEHVSSHPENSIIVPKWTGDAHDRGLVAMIPFLESISIYRPPDVRTTLAAYAGKDIPVEYAKTEAEGKRLFIEDWKRRGGGKDLSSRGFTLSGLFGGSISPFPPSDSSEPLTYLEQKRREAQHIYREEQAYIRAHAAEFDALKEQDLAAQASQMPGTLWGMFGSLAGGPQQQGPDGNRRLDPGSGLSSAPPSPGKV